MGVDLTLVFQRYEGLEWFLAYDRLSVERNYNLFEEISKINAQELPSTTLFDWYGDEGIERRHTDPYGDKLKWVYCGALSKAFSRSLWY